MRLCGLLAGYGLLLWLSSPVWWPVVVAAPVVALFGLLPVVVIVGGTMATYSEFAVTPAPRAHDSYGGGYADGYDEVHHVVHLVHHHVVTHRHVHDVGPAQRWAGARQLGPAPRALPAVVDGETIEDRSR